MPHEADVLHHQLAQMLRDLVDRLIDHEDELRARLPHDPDLRACVERLAGHLRDMAPRPTGFATRDPM